MSNEKLKEHMNKIKLCHLYIDNIELHIINNYKEYFFKYSSFDFSKMDINLKLYDIVIIELTKLSKENFKILNQIIKQNPHKDIYIFSKDTDNLFLLKFALHFSLNKIYSLNINDQDIRKMFLESSEKYLSNHSDKFQVEVSKKVNSFFSLLIFKDEKLIFANEKVKALFNTNVLLDIEEAVKNNENIYELISKNDLSSVEVIMSNHNSELWNYAFYCDNFDNNEKLITIIPYGDKLIIKMV